MDQLARVKDLFFDRAAVADAVEAGERKALSKFGAFTRTRARSSIRTRKDVSRPGSPPSSHTGLLKKGILFAYDPAAKSVVIGPVPLNAKAGPRVLDALEHGGTSVVLDGAGRAAVRRPIAVAARPFMGPAFETELGKVGGDYRNLIK